MSLVKVSLIYYVGESKTLQKNPQELALELLNKLPADVKLEKMLSMEEKKND